MADTASKRKKLKKRRAEQKAQSSVPEGQSQGPGITKITKPVQTERKFRGREQIGETKTTFKETFRDSKTKQGIPTENINFKPSFTPIDQVTDDRLREIGLSDSDITRVREGGPLKQLVEAEITRLQAGEEADEQARNDRTQIGQIAKKAGEIPLIGGTIKGAQRLGLSAISGINKFVGGDLGADIESTRRELGLGEGNVLTDPDVIDLALTGIVGGLAGKFGGKVFTKLDPLLAKTGAGVAMKQFTKSQAKHITKTAATLGVSEVAVETAVSKALLNQSAQAIAKGTSAKKIAAWGLGGATVIASVDVLTTWYALDNVMSGQKFFMKDIKAGLEDGSITPQGAVSAMEGSKTARDIAINKINLSTTLNPEMWAFRNLILAGKEADEISIALTEAQINDLILKGGNE